MHIVGVIEMIVGLAILTKWTRVGAYVASAWLVLIAINLVSTGMFFDVAVRDLEITLAALVLARMTEVRSDALHSDVPHERSAQGLLLLVAHGHGIGQRKCIKAGPGLYFEPYQCQF
jgi:hypothetical protein